MSKAFTIFGGTGDLTFRKLLPALYNGSVSGAESLDYEIVVIGPPPLLGQRVCALCGAD